MLEVPDDNYLYVSGSTTDVPLLSLKVVEGFLSSDTEITCYPTLLGYSSKALVELANTSSFHYRFVLDPLSGDEDEWKIITPEIRGGYIGPYERLSISWTFIPTEETMYHIYWKFSFDVVSTKGVSEDLANLNYEFIMPLAGVGETPHLMAEPTFIDFQLVPIYETKTRTFNIMNSGTAMVEVNLVVYHEQWLKDFPKKLIKISPTSVKIEGGMSTEVSVSIRPSRVNIQNFFILYEVINEGKIPELEVIENTNGEEETNEMNYGEVDYFQDSENDFFDQHLIDITFIGDHAIFKVTDILLVSTHPIWDPQQCWHMFSLELLNQCLVPYHHTSKEGTIPSQVSTVNFRFPPAPINSETAVFQINLSNTMDWAPHLKGNWTLWTGPPKNWRKFLGEKVKYKPKKMPFHNGHVKDDPDMLAILWARKFECSNPNSNEISLEGESPFDDEEQKCRTNEKRDTGMFEISPVYGNLKGKESKIITFKFKYECAGFYKMSVLLRVYPAIFMWIDLSAQTLEPDEPFIQIMENKLLKFHTVSLADLDPPLQMLWIYNGGNVPTGFNVDMEPFEKLKKENFNHAVIDCITTSGIVLPKSWFPIKLRFSPLEYMEYSVILIIKPDYTETSMEVILKGDTILAAAVRLRPDAQISSHRTFMLYDPLSPVSLSPSQITFSHFIPTGHKTSSSVFLTNLHFQNVVLFSWPDVPVDGGGCIKFQPKCGRICPREAVSCQVIVEAGNMAVILSTMIRCLFEDERGKDQVVEPEVAVEPDKIKSRFALPTCPKPVVLKPFSHLLSISVYIGSVFGLYDLISPKERSRMACAEAITANRPIPSNPDLHSNLILSNFERELSEELISGILSDIFSAQEFETYVRTITKRLAPYYEEYKECEIQHQDGNEFEEQAPELLAKPTEEILEATVFNLMQEMNAKYISPQTRDKWYELETVQPSAFVNVDQQENHGPCCNCFPGLFGKYHTCQVHSKPKENDPCSPIPRGIHTVSKRQRKVPQKAPIPFNEKGPYDRCNPEPCNFNPGDCNDLPFQYCIEEFEANPHCRLDTEYVYVQNSTAKEKECF